MAAKIAPFDPPSSASSERYKCPFLNLIIYHIKFCSDVEETPPEFSEVFPVWEIEEEKSGDFYQTPASPITVPYCRPPSQGSFLFKCIFNI